MDLPVPCLHLHDCSDLTEIGGYALSTYDNSTILPPSILSFINSTSLPLSREIAKGMESAHMFEAAKREEWKIIAPPNYGKGTFSKKQDQSKEINTESWNSESPISQSPNNPEQMQSSIAVVLPVISDVKIPSKFPPLVEVVIGEGDEAETRIAGIVYTRFNEQDDADASILSDSTDASWESD
mmetsp:Transcript_2121/g.3130  ORF Transcript_2121/g.3130 Transcript_2121/m.3130 type:complete len:183 (-) Transcript_2121:314-862(-)|eukprot:CAMPEP_0194199692 /NCGR_PEP_ID=MMETSP0156-20130528/616_1 /TAXON_ID=33649 /ORGANISM="Thalassionema nitzschioides, Strain L26-B" /LENGTH=182 /DNA_ID=CAMNT_0038924627 /DNA_START=93 /DNA_END=641 /DNA_ORIENTATION=+